MLGRKKPLLGRRREYRGGFAIHDPAGRVVATRATRALAEEECDMLDAIAETENKPTGYYYSRLRK